MTIVCLISEMFRKNWWIFSGLTS